MAVIISNDGCGCPPDYNLVNGECVKVETTPADYSGALVTIETAGGETAYGKFGLRLYDDLSNYVLPLVADGPNFASWNVYEDNGYGALVTPLLPSVKSKLWGSELPGCSTGSTGGKLNIVGIACSIATNKSQARQQFMLDNALNTQAFAALPPETQLQAVNEAVVSLDFCVEVQTTKQYLVGIAGDNEVLLYIDGVLQVYLRAQKSFDSQGNPGSGSISTRPFNYWHVFPVTLTSGQHILTLQGINEDSNDAFGAEVYDISLQDFQNQFTNAAVGPGDCGNAEGDIDPYIIFSTGDFVNVTPSAQIPDLSQPGQWSCPDGTVPNVCGGIPSCEVISKADQLPCCYRIEACLNPGVYIEIQLATLIGVTLDVGNVYAFAGDPAIEDACFKVVDEIPCDTPDYTDVTIVTDYRSDDCNVCIPCYTLTNCADINETLTITWEPTAAPLNTTGTVYVFDFDTTICWTAELEIPPCTGTQYGPSNIAEEHSTCIACYAPCYRVIDCVDDSIIYTGSDLSGYIGEIISWNDGVDDKCGKVEKYICREDPQTLITIVVLNCYKLCVECLPPPPLPVPPFDVEHRTVRPGYNTPACSVSYVDKVSCRWSEAVYQYMATERFGLEFCCETDLRKWSIKKELLNIALITDPEICKSIPAVEAPSIVCKEYTVTTDTKSSTMTYLPCGQTELLTVTDAPLNFTFCADTSVEPTSAFLLFAIGADCNEV